MTDSNIVLQDTRLRHKQQDSRTKAQEVQTLSFPCALNLEP